MNQIGYNPTPNPYTQNTSGYGSSMESEEQKADQLQIQKQQKMNKATYQNNISAYIQKLS